MQAQGPKIRFAWLLGTVLALTCACGADEGAKKDSRARAADATGQELANSDFHALYAVEKEWLEGPSMDPEKPSAVRLKFTDKLGKPVAVDEMTFKVWMKQHGHGGLDKHQKIERVGSDGSTFDVKNFLFSMSGPWELMIGVKIAGSSYAIELAETLP